MKNQSDFKWGHERTTNAAAALNSSAWRVGGLGSTIRNDKKTHLALYCKGECSIMRIIKGHTTLAYIIQSTKVLTFRLALTPRESARKQEPGCNINLATNHTVCPPQTPRSRMLGVIWTYRSSLLPLTYPLCSCFLWLISIHTYTHHVLLKKRMLNQWTDLWVPWGTQFSDPR